MSKSKENIVLIHAYECAPFHRPGSTIGAQRPYQFAKHLPKFGWRAIVLCCDFSRRYCLDPGADWKSAVRKEVVEALNHWDEEQSLTIPLPSLQFADAVDRTWLDTIIMDAKKGTFLPKKGAWNKFKRKTASFLKLFRGDHSQSWQAVALYASEILKQQGIGIDLQMAEHGPDASLFIAHKLSKQFSWPYWVDFRDPILQPINRKIRSFYRFFLKQVLLKNCRGLINVNPAWVAMDHAHFDLPTYLVTNGFDPEEFAFHSPKPNDSFTAAYLGNISFPTNLDVFFSGLKQFQERVNPKKFAFVYRGNTFVSIQKKAEQYGLSKLVDSAGPIPRQIATQVMQKANLLILFSIDPTAEKDPFLQKGYYPGKVFEYFATGNPILAVPGDRGVLDELLSKTKVARICNSPESVASVLKDRYTNWLQGSRNDKVMNWQAVEEYSRETQASILAGIFTTDLHPN